MGVGGAVNDCLCEGEAGGRGGCQGLSGCLSQCLSADVGVLKISSV